MIVHIKKGRHFARLWDLIKLTFLIGMFGKKRFRVTFTPESFEYSEPDDYVGAYNKLLGRNYGLVPYARWGSIRLGWRTTDGVDIIEFVNFVEDRSGFVPEHIAFIRPGESFEYSINHWGIPCWTFFGGKYPAPEDMQIEITRIDYTV